MRRTNDLEPAVASTLLADPAAVPRAKDKTTVAAPPADVDPMIGKVLLGQFVVREKIGQGGMGAVYLADQPAVGRTVVVKVLRADTSSARGSAARFNLEARTASKLAHPNIVTIFNYSMTDDGTLFLVMEHLEGQSLQALIGDEAPLPLARAAKITSQIAAALAEAHRQGVVHRDLKPSNVMLVRRSSGDELVKVLDFGVAKVEGVDLTVTGLLCGTPPYMSPEQFREGALDGRSDLYSLGVVLFEMLTGRLPFEAESPLRYMQKHLDGEVPRASSVAPKAKIPPSIDELLLRVLAKQPDDRPRSVEDFAAELTAALAPRSAATEVKATAAIVPAQPAMTTSAARAGVAVGAGAVLRAAWRRCWQAMVSTGTWLWARTGARFRRRPQPPLHRAFDTVVERLGLRRKKTLRQRLSQLTNRLRPRSGWRRWFRA